MAAWTAERARAWPGSGGEGSSFAPAAAAGTAGPSAGDELPQAQSVRPRATTRQAMARMAGSFPRPRRTGKFSRSLQTARRGKPDADVLDLGLGPQTSAAATDGPREPVEVPVARHEPRERRAAVHRA